MDIEMREKVKKAIRRALEIKTILFIIITSVLLVYFKQSYQTNNTITFGMKDSVFLMLLMVMMFWIMSVCMFLIYENRQLLKIIIQKNDTIVHQNETIETLVKQILEKSNNIEEQNKEVIENTEAILGQNEENFHQLMKSGRNTKEILLDRGDRIA